MRAKILVRLSLVVGLCALLLFILMCGLSAAIKAEPVVSSVAVTPEGNRLGLLEYEPGVPVCEQTQNKAPNPGFECDGEPWTGGWHESGCDVCDFTYDDPGHDSEVSAQINASMIREDKCKLFTPIHDIDVEGGRWYDYFAWVQADLSQGDAYLRVSFWSEEGGDLEYEGDAYTTGVQDTDGGWVQVTGSVQAPSEAEHARLEATLPSSSKGWVRFDDVFLGEAICLEIGKQGEPDSVSPGGKLTYTIVYSNTGRQAATDVWVIESYCCEDLRLVESIEWSEPSPVPYTDNLWETPYLGPGVSSTITIRVKLRDDTGQHASIVNGVQIRGHETTAPIYTTTSTRIVTDIVISDIHIYLPQSEKPGEPGCVTDYDLVLTNVGTCDGQGYLTATSSHGWDVIITPEPPCAMPPDYPQEVTVGLDVPEDAGDGITDVTSITATLACGPPCDETVTQTTMITTTVGQQGEASVYLPLVLREWPPALPSPSLSPISNPDGDGRYDVHWTAESLADSYVLEEDTNRSFPYPTETYVGTGTWCSISERGAARYYYRVKSRSTWGDSAWSDWEAVDVLWEREPNNALSDANGPLVRRVEYHGRHDNDEDEWDCYKIHPDMGGLVTAELRDHECTDVQFLLCYESSDNIVDRDWKSPYDLSYEGPMGWYYICIYTPESGCSTGTPYMLRATFPDSGLE